MATSYDIADRLIEHGDEVPDKDSFVRKMSDPKFAEEVRLQLKGYGDEVPDSSTFHNKYGIIKPSSYQFKPGQREGLLAAIREVGYSGLNDEQKALYKQQYDASDYAKAGHSFADAVRISDEKANQNQPSLLEKAQDLYKEARGGIGHITSIPVSYIDALQTTKSGVGADGKEIAVPRWSDNPSYTERVGRSAEELQKQAKAGEGMMGFVSDPTMIAQLGLAAGTLGSSIPAQTLIGGAGGGISHLMNTKDPTVKGTALSTGLGLGLGAAGTVLGSPGRRFAERELESGIIASDSKMLDQEIERLGKEIAVDKPIYNTMGIGTGDKPGTAAKEARLEVLNPRRAEELETELTEGMRTDPEYQINPRYSQISDELRNARVTDPVAEQHIGDLKAAVVQLDEKIKLGTKLGVNEKELVKLQSQKASLERQLIERQKRSLYPTVTEMLNRSISVSNPALSVVADKTGLSKVVDYVSSIPGKKSYGLLSGIGTVGSNVLDKYVDRGVTKISEEVSKDPMTKGLIKRIEKKVR